MNATTLLNYYLDQEYNQLFGLSANYAMTRPRVGYEIPWDAAQERIAALKDLIQQHNKPPVRRAI